MERWGMLNKFNICLNTDKYQFFLRNGGNGEELTLESEVPQVQQQTSDSAGH